MVLKTQTTKETAPDDYDTIYHIGLLSVTMADYFHKPSITMFDPFERADCFSPAGKDREPGYGSGAGFFGERRS